MGTLLDLANRMDKLAAGIDEAASQIAKDTALTIIGDLVYHTPVDTSRALSNWTLTIGSPATTYLQAHFPGKGGTTQKASAQEVITLAKAALANKKPGQIINITNNAPYIRRLNDGYSKQQPAGFVERSALVGRKFVEKAKLNIKG